jgi:hypothetical protein
MYRRRARNGRHEVPLALYETNTPDFKFKEPSFFSEIVHLLQIVQKLYAHLKAESSSSSF